MSDLDLIYGTKPKTPVPSLKEKGEEKEKQIPISKTPIKKENTKAITKSSMLASNQDRMQASNNASMISLSAESLESIRKIVKNPGKEYVLYVRLSKEEKDKIADVSYTYKRQGIRTSDNELVRVAINALIEDYKANGESSLLARIITSLHA
jgi:hypothetical protein